MRLHAVRLLCVAIFLLLAATCLSFVRVIRRLPQQQQRPDGARLTLKTARLEQTKRRICSNETTYCFADRDCATRCDAANKYRCVHGVCRNARVIDENPKNECDVRKGFVAYLIGDTAFANYRYLCKSIDPGVAVSPESENRMCKSSPVPLAIDYLKRYPSAYECECQHKAVVPATSVKREHVECTERYYDLIASGYA